ncbi:HTH domain-containing protein [Leptotrichia sp. OH3620_COT-345]|uniref:HTH domain-containing protein n=1 Tax=Leptotrichia sp. OH3620_COT-345 TaxID=2491048 RepID=UPI001F1BEA93|nr:HTH domain-containing protein [Leptotrichia sp. OH3620_COT-345]
MDSRIRKIFDLLSEDKYKTAENLSKKLNISSKRVRKPLKELNEIFEKSGAIIISKSG